MFTQCVSGVLILSSPPSARLLSFIWRFLMLNTTCSPCVWAFLRIRVTHGALFLLPHHRARPCSKWFYADMRRVLDCMDHGELTWTVLQCVRCPMLGLEKYVFFYFWKLSWHQQPGERTCTQTHRLGSTLHTGAAGRPLDGSVPRCISLWFRC